MLKKRAFNRIFISTVIFFVVFTLYSLKDITENTEINNKVNDLDTIYTLNDDGYVSKTEVYVSKVLSLEDKIKEKLQIMVENNNKNALLPSYFNPILPENTKIEDVKVSDSLVKVYFSKEFMNASDKQSEQMIEAITYTITNENILGIEIYVDGNLLKYVPHTKKELPTILTKDFGINKTYEISSNKDIVKIIMSYYGKEENSYYEVPVTKYLNDDREKVEIIVEQLSNMNNDNLISLLDNVELQNYEVNNDIIRLDINKKLNQDESDILVNTIFDNYDIDKIEISANNKIFLEKNKKDIEK